LQGAAVIFLVEEEGSEPDVGHFFLIERDSLRRRYADGPWCSVGTDAFGTAGGVWGGNWTCYSGWADYQQRNGLVCEPGTVIKGGDGILYMCQ
jgi:hypothetical protein